MQLGFERSTQRVYIADKGKGGLLNLQTVSTPSCVHSEARDTYSTWRQWPVSMVAGCSHPLNMSCQSAVSVVRKWSVCIKTCRREVVSMSSHHLQSPAFAWWCWEHNLVGTVSGSEASSWASILSPTGSATLGAALAPLHLVLVVFKTRVVSLALIVRIEWSYAHKCLAPHLWQSEDPVDDRYYSSYYIRLIACIKHLYIYSEVCVSKA